MLQAIPPLPPIEVTVQAPPTPLWTILAPLILSVVVALSTIYYARQMHVLAKAEKERKDSEQKFRAESASMQLNRLQIGLAKERPLGKQMRNALFWTDEELDRFLRNAHPTAGLTAGDFEVVYGMIRTLRGYAELAITNQGDDYELRKNFTGARDRLMTYLEGRRGRIVRGE